MVEINPVPKISHEDRSTDNSRQVLNVLNGSTISNNQDTNINVTISSIGKRLREMPLWIQLIAGTVVLIALYLGYRHFVEDKNRVLKFVSVIERDVSTGGTDFISASNSILNTIPNNVLQENEPSQWQALSRIWMRSGTKVDGVFSAATQCLRSGECAVGSQANGVCRRAHLLTKASMVAYGRLKEISGINVNTSGAESIFPLPTGVGEVRLPDMSNLFYVSKECGDHGRQSN